MAQEPKKKANEITQAGWILIIPMLALFIALAIVVIWDKGDQYPEKGRSGDGWESYIKVADASGRKYDYSYCSDNVNLVLFRDAHPTVVPKGYDHFPFELSPDGKTAVIADSEGKVREINLEGGILNELTSPTGEVKDYHPSYSPDGTLIAFARLDWANQNGSEIWVMNRDGSNLHLVAKLSPGLIKVLNFNEENLIFIRQTQSDYKYGPKENPVWTHNLLVSLDGEVDDITENCRS